MTEARDSSTAAPEASEVPDMPAAGDRGWSSLSRTSDEVIAFVGVVALLAVVVLATLLWGVPGLLMMFLLLTFVITGVLLVISVGS